MVKHAVAYLCSEKLNADQVDEFLKTKTKMELVHLKEQWNENADIVIDRLVANMKEEPLYKQGEAAKMIGRTRQYVAKHMERLEREGKLVEGKIPHSLLKKIK